MTIISDLYKRGQGVIQKFAPCSSLEEVKVALASYCEKHNVRIVAVETCGESTWNYLSDGTEYDYTIE